MKLRKNHYWIISVVTLFALVYLIEFFLHHKLNNLEESYFQKLSIEMNAQLDRLIAAKKNSVLGIALTLSLNDDIKKILQEGDANSCRNMAEQDLSTLLSKFTEFKNIWIQLIDRDGISRCRNWTDNYGDSVLNVRLDVGEMINNPQIMEDISTGKYSMTFKF